MCSVCVWCVYAHVKEILREERRGMQKSRDRIGKEI